MHNNYFFLSHLSKELDNRLSGSELIDCFSQNKDELVLGFLLPDGKEFFVVATLTSGFSSLYFPKEYFRARKNSVTLFEELLGRKVLKVAQVQNERLIVLEFAQGLKLVFKLYGNRSNIILFQNEIVLKIFKNSLRNDFSFSVKDAVRILDYSFEHLKDNQFEFKKALLVLGDIPVEFLQEKRFLKMKEAEQKRIWDEMIQLLFHPEFYVSEINKKFVLSLLPVGNTLSVHTSAIEAINAFYQVHYRYNFLEGEKEKLLFDIRRKVKEGYSYIQKCEMKIEELEKETSPSQLADIIMANLHAIPSGASEVKLFDFFNEKEIKIKMKKDLSPQKYAELLYKKAKGRPREVNMLKEQIRKKKSELDTLESDISILQKVESFKEFELLKKKHSKELGKKEGEEKFKVYELLGFKILVGRNAENNEELTQRYARKNDLWLHARDVAGSHVVVKFQAGKNFPRPVIEAAASLAAYYSKRKNEALCPVIYTEKKFVRKIKGAPAGQMKVEKENVILVEPRELTVDSSQ